MDLLFQLYLNQYNGQRQNERPPKACVEAAQDLHASAWCLTVPAALSQGLMEMMPIQYVKRALNVLWVRLALFFVLAVSASFSFLRCLKWAFAYSGVLGVPSELELAQRAYNRATFFFCTFVVLQIILAVIWASYWEPPDFDSVVLRVASRYGLGLAIAIVITAILVGLDITLLRVQP